MLYTSCKMQEYLADLTYERYNGAEIIDDILDGVSARFACELGAINNVAQKFKWQGSLDMLKDIAKIKLQGANFREEQELPLLSQNGTSVKASLVYGRNGSGKSTIAKAFKVLKGEHESSIQFVAASSNDNVPITIPTEDQSHLFVFDEEFVNTNIRVQEDGLGSIVMLGEQAGLADAIALATSELQTAETDRDQKRIEAEDYNNVNSEKSPKYYIEKMKAALKGDGNWAGRDKRIKGNAVNSSVSDDTYKNFILQSPTKTRDELVIDFNNEIENLKSAQSGTAKITATIPVIPYYFESFDSDAGNTLLREAIEHPELTEREQYLLSLVQAGHGEELKVTAYEFENSELVRCPKCHQPISRQYKSDLIASIQKVLSEEVKNHQQKLRDLQLNVLEMDLFPFQQLAHYQECIDSIAGLNQIIQSNNELLKIKEVDPYTPVKQEIISLDNALTILKTAIQQLENDRMAHNRTVADTRPIKTTLTRINNEIAYYDVIDFYKKYELKKQEKQTVDEAYTTSVSIANEKQAKLNELNARRDSINIAIDVINDGLKYIFFSDNRMQIQVDNGVYKLTSNGHEVRPRDVSVGERNIIGLCYFFTSILERKNRAAAYDEEYLLIIDDPVSSYDLENKVGILSYLKYQLGKFLLGNIETRALVLTHDLLTAIDIEKMFDELIAECRNRYNGQRAFSCARYELSNCSITRFENKRNEYTELLRLIFEYGNGGATEQGAYIGNIMRQVMEAFATFEYKKGIDSVSTDDSILSAMELEEDRVHYKNLMYRIVLNEGSHRYDQTRNMQMDFFAMISETERRRTAKEILCFMYLLNKPHIKAHLGERCCNDIERWCEEIRA